MLYAVQVNAESVVVDCMPLISYLYSLQTYATHNRCDETRKCITFTYSWSTVRLLEVDSYN